MALPWILTGIRTLTRIFDGPLEGDSSGKSGL